MSDKFDGLAEIYDRLIDWPKRLKNETPYLEELLKGVKGKRVLDCACGTGRHALQLSLLGCSVVGLDVSEEMLTKAREVLRGRSGINFEQRSFEMGLSDLGSFDLVMCIGNSLALASSEEGALQSAKQLFACVAPGGALLIQVLNLWALADGPPLWQKCIELDASAGKVTVVKGVQRVGSRGYVNLLVLGRESEMDSSTAPAKILRSESVHFLGLNAELLQSALLSAGASSVEILGGYRAEAKYLAEESPDLILVARRQSEHQ